MCSGGVWPGIVRTAAFVSEEGLTKLGSGGVWPGSARTAAFVSEVGVNGFNPPSCRTRNTCHY